MAMDWVPCLQYADNLTLVSGSERTGAFALMMGDTLADVSGKVEDTDDLFCHRIVGEIYFTISSATIGSNFMIGIMPLQSDVDSLTPQVPWDPATSFFAFADRVNLRYWGLRTYQAQATAFDNLNVTGGVTHPWHFHWDLKPRQKFGSRLNLWPSVIASSDDADSIMRVTANLRLLCSGR